MTDIASSLQSAAIAVAASFERLVSPKPLPLSGYRNFLLLQHPSALGTAIHATPLIPAIHATIPKTRIIAAASGFAYEVLSNNPGLERLIATPSPLKDLKGSARALRAAEPFNGEPYATLQSLGNERTKLTISAMLAGAHTRIGFTVLPQLSTRPMQFDPRFSQIANNCLIIDALGHGPALAQQLEHHPDLLEPQIFPTLEHTQTARQLLGQQGIDYEQPFAIFISQTSVTQRKSWRSERFRAAATMLHTDYNMQIVFVGTSTEAPAIDVLRAELNFSTANLAGKTTLLELSATMSLASIALTLDTGPMHLARAVRLPMVIIAPAWSPAIEWLPLNNPRVRILKNADLPEAPDDYIIDEVSVEEVEANLRELLTLYPPR